MKAGETVWVTFPDGSERPWPALINKRKSKGLEVFYLNDTMSDVILDKEKRIFPFVECLDEMIEFGRPGPEAWTGAIIDGCMRVLEARGIEVPESRSRSHHKLQKLRSLLQEPSKNKVDSLMMLSRAALEDTRSVYSVTTDGSDVST